LITDCLVCMGFSWFGFCFGFPASVVVPVHVLKRKARLKPATTAQFFYSLRPRCKKSPRQKGNSKSGERSAPETKSRHALKRDG